MDLLPATATAIHCCS